MADSTDGWNYILVVDLYDSLIYFSIYILWSIIYYYIFMKKFTFISWMELGLGIGIETVVGSLDIAYIDIAFINRSIVIKTFLEYKTVIPT